MTMTCYLNSLIQSLFFTPEFRNALYMYQYVDDIKKKKSIAFALHKLFLQLQVCCWVYTFVGISIIFAGFNQGYFLYIVLSARFNWN